MNSKLSKQFRSRLLEQREAVVLEMKAHRMPPDPGADHDSEIQAARATRNLVEDRITGNDENLLAKIDLALERLAAGTYQQCTRCGGQIPLDRLDAKPSASLCIRCQKAKDGHEFDQSPR